MRVLSQWLDVDIDYESSAFLIDKFEKEEEDEKENYAIIAFNHDHQFCMATYTDIEKAKKALQLMSSTYTRYLVTDHSTNNMTMTDSIECELDSPFNRITIEELKATAYQFPLDDELYRWGANSNG